MNPHRMYSSIYNQLIHIRPNVEHFPNLTTLRNSREKASQSALRLFPSSLCSVTFSWVNIKAPEIEVVLWSSVMNRLFLDAPLVEHIHFEGSPKEPLHSLTTTSRITIKPSPLDSNVLQHKYSHALSASAVRELDRRFVRWPDLRLQTQELAIASPECERSGDAMTQYTQLLILLADKYWGVFRALKIQHPLLCHDQAGFESFLRTVRTLADAGIGTLQLNLIVGWQELTREVQDMIEPSKWTVLRHFRITSRRASASWSWTAGNAL
ncbi:hypothetical protein L210DRAFT_3645851 [Boletus edulis BED1]|uniref:Uncharacterized protein n=1 Tax=Boletus edulis BED1 TaxID=1328754 RepID=A0AAD4GE61_BOLED|nr:hypothetical protein L210DRAFT_3645851 [Boletus edulis BED1]